MVYRHPLLMEKSSQGVDNFFCKVCCLFVVCITQTLNSVKTDLSQRTNEALICFKLQAGVNLVTSVFFFFSGQHP